MTRLGPALVIAIAAGLLGCSPSAEPSTTGTGTGTGTGRDDGTTGLHGSTVGAPGTIGSSTAAADSTASEEGVGFIGGSDFPPLCGPSVTGSSSAACPCDLFNPGWCAEGYKCLPWANDGGEIWNDTRCSPIARRPAAVGEPCTSEGGPTSGFDDCEYGAMCLFLDDAGVGECVAFPGGSYQDPICDAGTESYIGFDGVIALCLLPCDPLASDCESGLCIPNEDRSFVCFPALPPPSELGQACEYDPQCPVQSACTGSRPPWQCPFDACTCNALCDLQGMPPEASCAPGQVCAAWYEAGQEPAGLAHVGYCAG